MAETAVVETQTIRAAVARAAAALPASETPRLDAELLVAEALGVGRERLVIDRDEPVDPPAAARLAGLVARRAAREPMAYILGRRGFRRLTLDVDPRVLIPRPETELLVEVGLDLRPGAAVLDVGCGSGAVALALADERPDLDVRGVDISPDAVDVARHNAARLRLDVSFTVGDLLDGSAHDVSVPLYGSGRTVGGRSGRADAVLANLPYVPAGAPLAPDVAAYEPAQALFAGADGLDLVRRLVTQADSELLALEIAPSQAAEVAALVAAAGYARVGVRRDLADRDRVVVGSR